MKKFHLMITSLLLVFLMASPVSHGQLYKWVDEQGNVHYGDSPPDYAKLKRITGKVSSYTSVSVEAFVFDPDNISTRKKSTRVVMYSTSCTSTLLRSIRPSRMRRTTGIVTIS